MKLYHTLIGLCTAAMVASCSDDTPGVNPGNTEMPADSYAWFGMGVKLPSDADSRSATTDNGSTGGTEIGRTEENRIHRALIVFADKDNGFIAYATASQGGISAGTGSTTSTSGTGSITTNPDGVSAGILASVSASHINAYYSKKADPTTGILMDNMVNVYVYANYPQDLLDSFKAMGDDAVGRSDWTDFYCEVSERSSDHGSLTEDDNKNTSVLDVVSGLPMSNAAITTAYIPKSIHDWLPFIDEDHPFKMSEANTEGDKIDNSFSSVNMTGGPVQLQRSVARFDFKDGSRNNFTYHVGVYGQGGNTLDVQLIRMNLVNMSKHFYYLQRVSNNGHASGEGFKLCGRDLPGNYIVDYAADLKCVHQDGGEVMTGIGDKGNGYSKYYNFCFGSGDNSEDWKIDLAARDQWYRDTPSEVVSQGSNMSDATGEYKIWHYVTENAIPGINQQKVSLSTGIVFKGMLRNTPNTPANLRDAINENYYVDAAGNKVDRDAPGATLDHPILYLFDNVLYVKFTAVIAAAQGTAPGDVLNNAVLRPNTDKGYARSVADYYTAWQTAGGGQESGEQGYAQFMEFKKAAVDAGITIYQWATDEYLGQGQTTPHKGYFCYYYYWNRHNDNNIPGVMGPMEFAVVRNNVYKISVDRIRRIGHPRRTENDPDPQNPETPDEESDVYLDVQVTTLPWVVRRNSIEF